jgi:hypothetical protein
MTTKARTRSSRPSRREAREAQRRRQKWQRAAGVVAGLALVALVVVFIGSRVANQPGQAVPDMGNQHLADGETSPVAYTSVPPTSGPHTTRLASWGVHTEPIPDELQVHNLEDGGVGVWYDCPKGCPDLVTQLESIVRRYGEGVLMAPYPGMDSRIALTAWNRIDTFEDFDEGRIVRFVRAYRGRDHHAP